MKTLIILVVGLLAVGCATLTPEQKQKALRDSVVGECEFNPKGDTVKRVFLDNGIYKYYINGKKASETKWSIVKEEIHVISDSGFIDIWRINKDTSITDIAFLDSDGKREDIPKETQWTHKKIK